MAIGPLANNFLDGVVLEVLRGEDLIDVRSDLGIFLTFLGLHL